MTALSSQNISQYDALSWGGLCSQNSVCGTKCIGYTGQGRRGAGEVLVRLPVPLLSSSGLLQLFIYPKEPEVPLGLLWWSVMELGAVSCGVRRDSGHGTMLLWGMRSPSLALKNVVK